MRSDLGNLLKALGRLDEAKVGRIRGPASKQRFVVDLSSIVFVIVCVCVKCSVWMRIGPFVLLTVIDFVNACHFLPAYIRERKGSFCCGLVLELSPISVNNIHSVVPYVIYVSGRQEIRIWCTTANWTERGEVGSWQGLPFTSTCFVVRYQFEVRFSDR